ncbi:MAG: helix-turn-helix domain-containing protein [Pyrinomonadaceae bacterium]|nr:helix-turn-helix domain-containing protein [Pyrinomonadaceae bacterium]
MVNAPTNPGSTAVYDDGCLRVEYPNYFVACKGQYLDLKKTEFLLVSRLVRNIERVVTFQDLWENAWPAGKPLNLASLHVYMHKVRRKVAESGLRINNMINVGYSLGHGECCAPTSRDRQFRTQPDGGRSGAP